MTILVRSTTVNQSRKSDERNYHHYNQFGKVLRTFSKRKKSDHSSQARSRSYRNYRANQRRIFLTSFKLETTENLRRRRRVKSRRLQKLAVKVVTAVGSLLSFLRFGSGRLGSRDCRLAVWASDPTRVRKD